MGWESLPFERGDRYRMLRLLGEGGMGVVYEVEDAVRGQVVALKMLKRTGGDVLYRMKREFRALADIAHPNLVSLHDLVVDEEQCYLTMERVEGTGIVDHCRPGGRCDEQRLRSALPQLVQGIMALHQAGVVHRDIKPSNVLVEDGGRVVLLDFGLIAEVESGADSLAGQLVGSVEYMAPEQAAGEAAIPATDWYAVGVILYEALTGKVPFGGSIMEILIAKQQFPAPPPRQVRADVPEDLDELVVALLAREPGRRPDGAQILARLGHSTGHDVRALASVSRMPAFAGRASELAELDFGLDQVAGGRCAVALVRGPSGIGKSTLVQHWLDTVRDREPDLLLLVGRCYERETVPYKAVDDLVDQLARYWMRLDGGAQRALVGERDAVLRRLFPVLGRVPAIAELPDGPTIRDPLEMRTQAFEAFRALLQRLAERHRLVVFLDDMQWVDADSISLLTDLVRPPDPPRMLLVLASRTERQRADTATGLPRVERGGLEQLLRTPGLPVREVDLGPLAQADARSLAVGLLVGGDASLAERVARESGGVPFFLRELAMWIETSDQVDDGEIRLDDVVRARVARLPERTRDVLRLCCLAGEPVTVRVLAAAADCTGDELAREVRTLRSTSLLRSAAATAERVEPFHDRIREAVRAELGLPAQRDLHRRLALALERFSEGDAVRLARHWSGAGEHQRAADLARAAAEQSAAVVDFDRAARLYEMALDLGDYDATERRRLGAALGVALGNAGRPQESARAFLTAADGADRATQLELRYRAASQLVLGGFIEEGLVELRQVLAEVGLQLAPTPGAALRSFLWRRFLLRLRGPRWRERPAEEVPARMLMTLDIVSSVAVSLALVDTMRGADYEARFALMAYRVGEPNRVVRALGLEAAYLGGLGSHKRARVLAEMFERERARCGSNEIPFGAWARGAIHYFCENDWQAALGEWEQAEVETRSLQSSGWALDTAQTYACFARLYLGDLPALARAVPSHVREAERRGDLYASVNLRTRLPIVHLMRDQPGEAERDLRDALDSWVPRDENFLLQHMFGLIGAVHLYLYRDEPERAQQELDDTRAQLESSVLMHVPFVRVEIEMLRAQVAIALAERSSGTDRDALLLYARKRASFLAGRKLPYAAAIAAVMRGSADRVAGDDESAAVHLRAALTWFDASNSGLHAASVRRRLGELMGGREGGDLRATSDTDFAAREVVNPAAMTRLFVP